MAEGTSEDTTSWESWLGGWYQTAKEKSSSALEFVKRDLAEFSSTIQESTEKAIEKTSSSLNRETTEQATTKVKAGITSFLGNISKALVIPPSDDYVPVTVSADGTALYDRGKARLHAIQLDASTYADPPRGTQEQYEMWLTSFDMEQYKGEISEILVSKVEVRALYTKLVPNEASHAEFWQRYFYRVHQLQCDEARKQALMQRADRTQGDSLSWDDDDWSGGEDDDDGNQSDWEKMPRPQQQTLPSDQSLKTEPTSNSPHSDPCPSSIHNSTDILELQDPANLPVEKNNLVKTEPEKVSPQVSNTTSSDKDSTSFSTKADSDLEPVHDHFSFDSSHVSEAQASQKVTEGIVTEANPVSQHEGLQVPTDTASASTPEEQIPSTENAHIPEPGSPAETSGSGDQSNELRNHVPCDRHQSPGASSAAAASGVHLSTSLEYRNNIPGDAACGAAEVFSSQSPSLLTPQENDVSNLPDASSASKDVPNLSRENPLSLQAENQDKSYALSDTASAHLKSDEQSDIQEQGVQRQEDMTEGKAGAETVKDDNDPELAMKVKGDMVVVGETDTPSSSDSSDAKGLGEDWEEDFDVELTEEDLKAAEDIAKRLGDNLYAEDDDWENWE